MTKPLIPEAVVSKLFAAVVTALGLSVADAEGQLFPANPFTGQLSETFESFPAGFTTAPISVMGGAASVQTTAGIAINRPFEFNFLLGDSSTNAPAQCAVPADGVNLLGVEQGFGKAAIDVVFTNSVKAFGGYWGATTFETNVAILRFAFFDATNGIIGATQAVSYIRLSGDGAMEWHGWYSTTPFKKVNVMAGGSTMVGDSFRAASSNLVALTSVSQLGAGQFLLSGNGDAGALYTVQGNTNLNTTNWLNLGTSLADTNGALLFTNAGVGGLPQRFYRLRFP